MGMFSPRFSVDEVMALVPRSVWEQLRASENVRDRALLLALASLERIAGADSPEGNSADVDAFRNLKLASRLLREQSADLSVLMSAIGNTQLSRLAGEIGNTYVQDDERYVVSLIVGYHEDDAGSVQEAAQAALALTRGEGSDGTHWYVYDRATGVLHLLEQRAFEGGE